MGEKEKALTLIVVSSEDVSRVWPFWPNWQCNTVLVCPSSEARTFPLGTSRTLWGKMEGSHMRVQVSATVHTDEPAICN